ncbi:nicotinate-nucleotide adenylyltransferase [Micromonospora okii]|uniref:nicotinate-nucleotide adenylyltransferase n=1 Tax=Micromonospora okii TaxID=1182970 RepID=UPI001E4D1B98|nr:nicotinate-nucleotide adenylyltransferase [Micromonospora okii]
MSIDGAAGGGAATAGPRRLREGSAHGRFQVLHTQHLEYLLAAAESCDLLYVGITQPRLDLLRAAPGAQAHRHDPLANPLTYGERAELVTECLVAAGVDRAAFAVRPFPIERPELLTRHIPLSATAYTTVCDEWNLHKIELLRGLGYTVRVLFTRDAGRLAGSTVRRLMAEGAPEWTSLVPAASRDWLLRHDIPARLRAAAGRGGSGPLPGQGAT